MVNVLNCLKRKARLKPIVEKTDYSAVRVAQILNSKPTVTQ